MANYTFTYTKSFDISIEASTEHEAWIQAMEFTADSYPADWEIGLRGSKTPVEVPLDQGPCEVDDWDPPEIG